MSKSQGVRAFSKKAIISFVVLTTILWSVGLAGIPTTEADAGFYGSHIEYVNDGGATPDVFLDDPTLPELVLSIEAFESQNPDNTNKITSITLEITDAMGTNNQLTGFLNTDLAEISLWKDTDGNKSFSTTQDTLLATSNPSAWDQLSNPSRWQHTFTGLNVDIPTAYTVNNQNRIFVTAKVKSDRMDLTPLRAFHFQIPKNGVKVSVDPDAALTDFPVDKAEFFPPVHLGTEGKGGAGKTGSAIVISEIQTAGGTNDDEFIELYNRSPDPMNLTGYRIGFAPADSDNLNTWTNWIDISSGTIPANGFYLIANDATGDDGYDNEEAVSADATYNAFSLDESGGYVALLMSSGEGQPYQAIDMVGYGSLDHPELAEGGQAAPCPGTDGSIERKAFSDSTLDKMKAGGIHHTKGNCEDTNYNAGDFILRATADPQNTSSAAESPGGGPGEAGVPVIINEIKYNTAEGQGWIELYNRTSSNQNIVGWKLVTGENAYTIPNYSSTAQMPSGGFITIHWNKTGADDETSAAMSNLYTGTSGFSDMGIHGGDVLLQKADNTIRDYVQYSGAGFSNEAAASAAGEWMTGDYVPNVLYNHSIGRRSTTGEDYNSAGDWQEYSVPTPGYPNIGGDSTAPEKVTNVALTDPDKTNYGVDGNDIEITWKPSLVSDPSFDRYELYLLPANTALDAEVHHPIDEIYGGQYQYDSSGNQLTTSTYTGAGFIVKDSADNNLTNGDYIAYIIAVDLAGNSSPTAMSPAASLSDTPDNDTAGTDAQKPMIMHMGVWQAQQGKDIVLLARFDDNRQLGAVPGVGAQVVWEAATNSDPDLADGGTTTTNCVEIESDYYSCTIPWDASWNENTVIGYYLKSADASGNIALLSSSPEADTADYANSTDYEKEVRKYPFEISITAPADFSGTNPLSGVVYKSDGGSLAGAKLFLEGTAIGVVTAGGDGSFGFLDNTVAAGSYNLLAFKDGYMDGSSYVFKNDSGISIYLNKGEMNIGEAAPSAGGYVETPFVSWTAPMDGMMGAPTDIFCAGDCSAPGSAETPIVIAFSKEMNPNTINDQDAANAGSNIYLTTDNKDRVAGKVYYDASTKEARFFATTHNSLNPGTLYNIVVTQEVTDINGNPISGGAGPGGIFSNSFTTMMDNSAIWGTGWKDYYEEEGEHYGEIGDMGGEGYMGMDFSNFGQGGMMMPPYVMGTTPQSGAFGVSQNTAIIIEFSEQMDSSSISSASVKLVPISDKNTWKTGPAVAGTVTLDQATQRIVTFTPTNALDLNAAQEGWYQIQIMGSVKSATGMWTGDPRDCGTEDPDTCLKTKIFYRSDFQLNTDATTASDTTPPKVLGSYPGNGDTGIDVGIPAIEIGFSESMNPSSINAQNITLKAGSSAMKGKVKYDPMENSAKFIPANALSANTKYALTVNTTVTDLAGNSFDQDQNVDNGLDAFLITFKTGSADTANPEVLYANADDFTLAITFSEPMNAAKKTDPNRWTGSALNPANYYIKSLGPGASGLEAALPYNTATQLSSLSGLNFEYDEPTNTITIEGFDFFAEGTHPTDYQLFIDNVKDKSNNVIANSGERNIGPNYKNSAQGPIQNSKDTFGMLGPGGGGMMMMGPTGGATTGMAGPSMDMDKMGMMEAGAMPMNMIAGQTSIYFVDVPITKQIKSGGKIVLTFPSGFNVAKAKKDPNSPINNDINEGADGTIGFTVDANQTSRTITITTTGDDTLATDFLHFDLKGIVNSSIPKEFGTSGYSVDIKTMSPAGVLLETIETMPFYLQEGGAYTLSGTITARDGADNANVNITNNETMTLFLGSPMTGPVETLVTFDGDHNADYSFTGLSKGEYHLFTDPIITLDVGGADTDFEGLTMPESIWLTGNTSKDIKIKRMDSGAGTDVTVTLIGDFRSGSPASADDVDIFASSPSGFRVKTVAPGNTAGTDYHLFLPAGDWMIGVGPAMPKGPMAGPLPMPDWMPPMPTHLNVSGAGAASITIDISGQQKYEIKGKVVDDSGTGIADAEVWAFQPMGGMGGSNTKTDTSGNFTLKVGVAGMYQIGAHKPGLPDGKEITKDVLADVTGVVIKLKKPAYTISGKVLNADSKAIAYAPVWAWQEDGFGHSDTMTDASGNYILYVDSGKWHIETDAPGMGGLEYDIPVVISSASQTNINLKPAVGLNFYDISGNIKIENENQKYTPLRAVLYDCTSGAYLGKEFGGMTDALGNYTISVPGPSGDQTQLCYRVDTWTSEYGEIEPNNDEIEDNPANVKIINSDKPNINILIATADLNNVSVVLTNGDDYSQEGFLHIEGINASDINNPKPTGFHKSLRITDLSATSTVKLENGDYFFDLDIPGLGFFMPNSASRDATKNCIVVNADKTVTFDLPDKDDASEMVTIQGTAYAGSETPGNELENAWVWVENPDKGFHKGVQTAADGSYSLNIPVLSSGTYKIGADKPGYMSGKPTDADLTDTDSNSIADNIHNFVLTSQQYTIHGKIYADAAGGTANSYDPGEEIPNGWVHAEEINTGKMSYAPVDGAGCYELGITNGNWRVFGSADGYLETLYSENGIPSIISVNNASQTNKHIKLDSDAQWTTKTKSKTMKPSSGGTIDDTVAGGAGIKVTVPPQALGSSTSNGNIAVKETSSVSKTHSAEPFAGKGKEITAVDNSGKPITDLRDYIDIELVIYKAEVDAQVAAKKMADKSKLKPLQAGYWDDTIGDWVSLPTVKTAYYKKTTDTEWTMYKGDPAAGTTGYEEFIDDALTGDSPLFTDYDDYKLVLKASANHLTVFGAIKPKDSLSPKAPVGLTQTAGTGTSVAIGWTAVTKNTDDTTCTDLLGYEIYRSADNLTYTQLNSSDIATTSYTDSAVSAWTSYYYKVTAADDGGNESAYSSPLQICSNKTVNHGTVAADCAITCDTGYIKSGNSCVVSAPSGGVYTPPIETVEEEAEEVEEIEEAEEEATEQETAEQEKKQEIEEKSIAEMNVSELQVKITEIQQSIIQVKALLIQAIKEKIVEIQTKIAEIQAQIQALQQ